MAHVLLAGWLVVQLSGKQILVLLKTSFYIFCIVELSIALKWMINQFNFTNFNTSTTVDDLNRNVRNQNYADYL